MLAFQAPPDAVTRPVIRYGKDRGKNHGAPAVDPAEAENVGDFAELGWDRDGARDHVKQNVPLRAEQHQQNRAGIQSAAETNQAEQQNREERGGRNRRRDLGDRLRDARQARVEADGDAGRDGPRRCDHQRREDAQERGAGAFDGGHKIGLRDAFKNDQTLKHAVKNHQQRDDTRENDESFLPFRRLGLRFRGPARCG